MESLFTGLKGGSPKHVIAVLDEDCNRRSGASLRHIFVAGPRALWQDEGPQDLQLAKMAVAL
ncbi:MAG: hypothetical protein ACTHJ3_07460 [Pararhizobium sp.]